MSAPTEDFVSGRLRSSLNVIHRTDLRQTLRRKLFVLAVILGFFDVTALVSWAWGKKGEVGSIIAVWQVGLRELRLCSAVEAMN